MPLKAYKRIQTSKIFSILGGSKKYSDQAKLNLKNFKQLPSSADTKIIGKFLNTLDVYTHGRKHGETMGLVLTEAMSYGLPIISHRAESNAQVEVIGNAGRVFYKRNIFSYSGEMKRLENNSEYYNLKSKNSLDRFNSFYSLSYILDKYDRIIKSKIITSLVCPYTNRLYFLIRFQILYQNLHQGFLTILYLSHI